MKNKFILSIVGLFSLALSSCEQKPNNSTETISETFVEEHTAQNSLDWSGTYEGTLPCADCEGILTKLTLQQDGNYSLITEYLGKESGLLDTLNGTFTWDGNVVKLEGISQNTISGRYKVEENRVRHLDMEGNVITGELADNYILKKVANNKIE
ncbi:copper resistance protein NlpE [Penaeicola halotolerans]|uniref:copper resistance protein NlpE n=1 Tax=Penaeicola halotolerans TaxID=2793196 RepID=UPI001CF84F9D|nr:copper resistance protein NlpE [Penaeicola halotolerans]